MNQTRRRTVNIRSKTDVTMLTFSWGKLNEKLQTRLDENEFAQMTDGLKAYAWNYFIEE